MYERQDVGVCAFKTPCQVMISDIFESLYAELGIRGLTGSLLAAAEHPVSHCVSLLLCVLIAQARSVRNGGPKPPRQANTPTFPSAA